MKIKDHEIDVDVLEELEMYEWDRKKIKPDEMVCCSPFRNEKSPSFSINLSSGLWIDFGAGEVDDIYNKGNLVTLLSFLRSETHEEVEAYLLEKYGIDLSDVDSLSLNINLSFTKKESKIISLEEYKKYAYRSKYLNNRGISDQVQKAFKIGFDKKSKAVAFPWMDKDGNIANVKFRSTKSKQFYYYPEGQQIKNLVYGINFIYQLQPETVYICESEIDCLYLWSNGKAAIALGSSNISDVQRNLIIRSPFKNLVIATDNDSAGRKIKNKIINKLSGSKNLFEIDIPHNFKDINDLPPNVLLQVTNNYRQVDVLGKIKPLSYIG